jgi:hypothetical protein
MDREWSTLVIYPKLEHGRHQLYPCPETGYVWSWHGNEQRSRWGGGMGGLTIKEKVEKLRSLANE